MKYNFVAIEGSIGVGKTTLAKMFARDFNARLLLERFEENPFLEKFYSDPERYAFATEMGFMADRYQQLAHFFEPDIFQPNIVSDYAAFKSLIFAKQNLDESEFHLYRQFYDISFKHIQQADLIVHLNRPTEVLLEHIKRRGRSFEQEINASYLADLKQQYLQFYTQFPKSKVLVVELESLDFIGDEAVYADLKGLLKKEYSNGISYINLNKT